MNTAIIITVTICATLFLSLAALLFAAVRINKSNRINANKQIDYINKTCRRTEGSDNGEL